MSIPAVGVGSLSTLLKRLEAATSRLEDIALAQAPTSPPSFAAPSQTIAPSSTARTTSVAIAPSPPAPSAGLEGNAAVKGFEELIQVALAKYLTLSTGVGGLVLQQACQPHTQSALGGIC